MSKRIKTYESYSTPIATYIIEDCRTGERFIGEAHCHDADKDMENEFTGLVIAQSRAEIKYLKAIKKRLIIEKDTLFDYYNQINRNEQFTKEHYAVKTLFRKINSLEREIKYITEDIKTIKTDLRNYICAKDTLYKTIRKNRTEEILGKTE